jgi:hypothetical protein
VKGGGCQRSGLASWVSWLGGKLSAAISQHAS